MPEHARRACVLLVVPDPRRGAAAIGFREHYPWLPRELALLHAAGCPLL